MVVVVPEVPHALSARRGAAFRRRACASAAPSASTRSSSASRAPDDEALHGLAEEAATTGRASPARPAPAVDLGAKDSEDDWQFNIEPPGGAARDDSAAERSPPRRARRLVRRRPRRGDASARRDHRLGADRPRAAAVDELLRARRAPRPATPRRTAVAAKPEKKEKAGKAEEEEASAARDRAGAGGRLPEPRQPRDLELAGEARRFRSEGEEGGEGRGRRAGGGGGRSASARHFRVSSRARSSGASAVPPAGPRRRCSSRSACRVRCPRRRPTRCSRRWRSAGSR